jgi:beta-glucanase (GH16 family)
MRSSLSANLLATSALCLAVSGSSACGKTGTADMGAGGKTGTGGTAQGAGGTAPGTGGAVAGNGGIASTGGKGGGAGEATIGSGGLSGAAGRSTGTPSGGAAGSDGDGGTGRRNDAAGRTDATADSSLGRDVTSDSGGARNVDGGITIPPGYTLVWSDEFDVDGTPNPKSWNYEKGFARNEELQWYQSDNATVKDGLLVIEARKERVSNPNYKSGSSDWKTSRQYAEYTSTSMTTSGLQSWQYGRFEMRARIPTSAGMWPAWWTLGVSGEWPSNGEIDIMEFYKGSVLANVACGTSTRWTAKWDSSSKPISSLGSGWASSFHVWRMDWDDQAISLYLDDNLMNTSKLSDMLNPDGTSPFKQKAYMLVNLAIGGTNGGDPSGTSFPQRYEVDWIRVFQKQ